LVPRSTEVDAPPPTGGANVPFLALAWTPGTLPSLSDFSLDAGLRGDSFEIFTHRERLSAALTL